MTPFFNSPTVPCFAADYYVPSYAYKRRSITGEVLIYVRGDMVAYFYIDRNGRVEDVFIGGS